jgi:threonine dehydrogenase-like Zn-dependent dehydrogenase
MKCFAEYAVADVPIVMNGCDPEVACFADPVVVALNHVYHAHATSGDTVLVVGQGCLGLLVTQLLRHQHINVIATDIKTRRLDLARTFGAKVVDGRQSDCEEQLRALCPGMQAVIDCSGADEVLDMACRLLARGGTLVMMGAYRSKVSLDYTQLRIRGATVEFPMNGVKCKDNWEPAAEILRRTEIEVTSLVDHHDRLENLQSVLEHYDEEWLRVILEP